MSNTHNRPGGRGGETTFFLFLFVLLSSFFFFFDGVSCLYLPGPVHGLAGVQGPAVPRESGVLSSSLARSGDTSQFTRSSLDMTLP